MDPERRGPLFPNWHYLKTSFLNIMADRIEGAIFELQEEADKEEAPGEDSESSESSNSKDSSCGSPEDGEKESEPPLPATPPSLESMGSEESDEESNRSWEEQPISIDSEEEDSLDLNPSPTRDTDSGSA